MNRKTDLSFNFLFLLMCLLLGFEPRLSFLSSLDSEHDWVAPEHVWAMIQEAMEAEEAQAAEAIACQATEAPA